MWDHLLLRLILMQNLQVWKRIKCYQTVMFDVVRKNAAEVHFKVNWSKRKLYSDKNSLACNHFVGLKIKNEERMTVMKTEEKNLRFQKEKYLEQGQKSKCKLGRRKIMWSFNGNLTIFCKKKIFKPSACDCSLMLREQSTFAVVLSHLKFCVKYVKKKKKKENFQNLKCCQSLMAK